MTSIDCKIVSFHNFFLNILYVLIRYYLKVHWDNRKTLIHPKSDQGFRIDPVPNWMVCLFSYRNLIIILVYVKLDGTCSNILLSDDKSDNFESALLSGSKRIKEYAFFYFYSRKIFIILFFRII